MDVPKQRYLEPSSRDRAQADAHAAQREADAKKKAELKKHSPKPVDVSTFVYLRERGWKHVHTPGAEAPHWVNEDTQQTAKSTTEAVLIELEKERSKNK